MQQVSKTRVFCSATKYDAFSFFSPSFDYLLIVWGRLLCWQYNRDVIREMETQIQYSRASVPLKATTEHQILPHIQTANQLQIAKKFSVRTNYPWVFAT